MDYRKNVLVVLFNDEGKVFFAHRSDVNITYSDSWQFPQGGIDEGEDVVTAAIRELEEETSITSVEFIKTIDKPFRYDYPHEIQVKFYGEDYKSLDKYYIGQEQYIVFLKFTGNDSEINLETEDREFDAWEWVDIKDTPARVIEFKRGVYYEIQEFI